LLAGRVQHFLIVGALKLGDPKVRVAAVDLTPQALESDFLRVDLAVLITLAVVLSPAMVMVALPLVFLVRRFLEYPILVAQSRTDAKTGLLNAGTWETEAEAELSRIKRISNPVAIALVDIDHFKKVNDTYGHLVGDRVLKTLGEALTTHSRDYDRIGRFGGEEFVILLAQTGVDDACNIAQRLRAYVETLPIPLDDRPDAPTLSVTISIGVTAMQRSEQFELADLLAAADSAMYAAKRSGRNRVAYAVPLHDMGLRSAPRAEGPLADETGRSDGLSTEGAPTEAVPEYAPAAPQIAAASGGTQAASLDAPAMLPAPVGSPLSSHRVVLVQSDQPATSLCLQR
jgi:diguanylate cyclase (GGDEF)-like protein